jgi:hypothetical protein
MTLSKRETTLVIAAAGTLVLLLLNAYALQPYLQASSLVDSQTTTVRLKLGKDLRLLQNRGRVDQMWHKLRTAGLSRNAGTAENSTLQHLLQYAHDAGVSLQSLQPTRMAPSHHFQVVRVEATGQGSTAAVALFMWCIETSRLPLRLNSVHMVPQKPGADHLTFQLSVGTLVYAPTAGSGDGNEGDN